MLRVLLVCTGNICRSPIAQGLLAERSQRTLGNAIEVRSAGTWARDGSRATREAVAAAAGLRVDIGRHRSSRFTDGLARWADLIITMTAEQRAEVLEEAPDAAPKTFTLKELVALLDAMPAPPDGPDRDTVLARIAEADVLRSGGQVPEPADADVVDPLGLSETVYRAVAHEMNGLIDRLLEKLLGERGPVLAREA